MGWREQFETVAGGRRTVELSVRLGPEEAVRALREHLVSEGSYEATVETEGVLEVEHRSPVNMGCGWNLAVLVLLSILTFGVVLVLALLWVLFKGMTNTRRLRLEASPSGSGGTRLTISGYPRQAVTEAEEWIQANLPIVDQH